MMTVAAARGAGLRLICALFGWVSGVCLGTIFAINIAQIVYRLVGPGWIWVSDLSRLLFTWTVMAGATAAYARKEHIVTDFLAARLAGASRLVVALLVRGVELCFMATLCVAGIAVATSRADIAYVQLGVSTSWAFWAIPVCAAAMVLASLFLPIGPQPRHDEADTIAGTENRERTGT
ncbi:MAG: TRAP transporter small permease [Haloechinothrix sp.]